MTNKISAEFVRQRRAQALNHRIKIWQGIGAIPETILAFALRTFVLLYYNQVLGVDAHLVSIAMGAALFFDALTDPVIASFSDNLRSRYGRRHPLMFIASIPLGLSVFGVFSPPTGLSDSALVAWLFLCSISLGISMTLFSVPWNAIAAELSDDYDERTSIMSYRYAVGFIADVCFPLMIFTLVMPGSDEFNLGQLDPSAYKGLAISAAVLLSLSAITTTLMTANQIPYLRQHSNTQYSFNLKKAYQDLSSALQNRQFALLFSIVLISSAIGGILVNIDIYMTSYFWGLGTEELSWFAISGLGALLAFPVIAYAQKRWEKRSLMIACAIASLIDGILWVNLRLLGFLPENGDPLLLVILVSSGIFTAFIAIIEGVIGASVVADIVDHHELHTGRRQEGMFYAALAFSGKVVSSFGIAASGFIITLIGFPKAAKPSDISEQLLFELGLYVGILIPLFYIIPIYMLRYYKITRASHKATRERLSARQS